MPWFPSGGSISEPKLTHSEIWKGLFRDLYINGVRCSTSKTRTSGNTLGSHLYCLWGKAKDGYVPLIQRSDSQHPWPSCSQMAKSYLFIYSTDQIRLAPYRSGNCVQEE